MRCLTRDTSAVPSAHMDTVQRMYDAFNARDLERYLALSDEAIEVETRFASSGGALFKGRDRIERWWSDLADAWEQIEVHPESAYDVAEDTTYVLAVLRGKGRHSGVM